MDNPGLPDEDIPAFEAVDADTPTDTVDAETPTDTVDAETPTDPSRMLRKLKKELQCPVCDQIPSSLPIPTCPSGHIVCKECKEKIVYNRELRDKPCPVCRAPLGWNTSYLAGTLISSFTDISCSNRFMGCIFQGNLDEIKDHLCQFQMVTCFICDDECMAKDFFNHNSKDCFLKDIRNTFTFPTRSCLYLAQGGFQQEVLVDVWYVKKEDDDERSGIDYVGFTSFGNQTSNPRIAMPAKMKMVVEDPEDASIKLEVITEIDNGPYRSKKIVDHDVVLGDLKKKNIVRFEIIY